MLPKIIKDAILSFEGQGYAGKIKSIDFPKLARKMEEYRGGGMNGPVEIDLGNEKLEMAFEIDEQDLDLFKSYGCTEVNGLRFRINASAESDSPNIDSDAIEVVGTGRIRTIESGSFKPGDVQTAKYEVALATFTYKNNGSVVIDIDHANNILVVDGVDLLAKRRENLRQ